MSNFKFLGLCKQIFFSPSSTKSGYIKNFKFTFPILQNIFAISSRFEIMQKKNKCRINNSTSL